jgi:hypothetical protein
VRLVAGALTGGAPTSSRGSLIRGRKVLFIDAVTQQGPCQVRSKTESPCPRRAAVEILGVAFCVACAREQRAYFAIGELTQQEAQGFRSKPLADVLERMPRERARSTEDLAAEMHHGHSGSGSLATPFSVPSFPPERDCRQALPQSGTLW